ncbi:MAG: hypothetical protein LWW85_14560, partial [Marinilabiliales bacterium]|nr:hypothetical protein [Marinilabiliales bacterium]
VQETLPNQLEIIRLLSNMGEEEDIPFLTELAALENKQLRLEACRTLYALGEAGENSLRQLDLAMGGTLTPYVEHIKDPRN